jgi:hydrogenase maturation factor
LRDVVFKNLGAARPEVILGPSAGIDGAVINVGNNSVICSADPITGAVNHVGSLAVNVNANDVATFGCQPMFLLSCVLIPEKSDKAIIEIISKQMGKTAKKLGMAIVGGHSETTQGLTNPIVIGCAIGITKKGMYVTAAGAKANDDLILTKTAGIEGTAILATDRTEQLEKVLDQHTIQRAKQFYRRISIVKEALIAFKIPGIHAMHDPTEGGVAGAIYEMADASNLGANVFREKVKIQPETQKICDFFEIDPLRLVASGSLLIASAPGSSRKIIWELRKNAIPAEIIGKFLSSPKERFITCGRTEELLARPITDELWHALARS